MNLDKVALREKNLMPEEIMICESQGRMAVQVAKKDFAPLLKAIRGKTVGAEVIGEINNENKEAFEYKARPSP